MRRSCRSCWMMVLHSHHSHSWSSPRYRSITTATLSQTCTVTRRMVSQDCSRLKADLLLILLPKNICSHALPLNTMCGGHSLFNVLDCEMSLYHILLQWCVWVHVRCYFGSITVGLHATACEHMYSH